MTVHLSAISLSPQFEKQEDRFPFSVPAIKALWERPLRLTTPFTFFVGENGSGKSTLLEALAYATDLPTVGSVDIERDASLVHGRELGDCLRLQWTRGRTRRGLFLRAEDFFGFAKRMDQTRSDLEREVKQIDDDPSLSERSRGLARMAFISELEALKQRYGDGVDTRSHGEQFLNLFGHRLTPNGLHLIDEPEAPLSPSRQLSLISLMRELVQNDNAQFIIATHSPLLMAIPNATIYEFSESGISQVAYDDLEHVSLTRDFLNDPESFLRYL